MLTSDPTLLEFILTVFTAMPIGKSVFLKDEA